MSVMLNEDFNYTEIRPFTFCDDLARIPNMKGKDVIEYVNDDMELCDNYTVYYWIYVLDKFGRTGYKINRFFHVTDKTKNGILEIDYKSD